MIRCESNPGIRKVRYPLYLISTYLDFKSREIREGLLENDFSGHGVDLEEVCDVITRIDELVSDCPVRREHVGVGGLESDLGSVGHGQSPWHRVLSIKGLLKSYDTLKDFLHHD